MNQCTQEVRIANWRTIIEQCQARPERRSAKPWLEDNGIYRHRNDQSGDSLTSMPCFSRRRCKRSRSAKAWSRS